MSESNARIRQWHELKQRITLASTFVLTTHQNPDADGIGSELALYYLLKKLGKDVHIFNISPTPENLKFMDAGNLCQRYIPSEHQSLLARADIFFVLDAGSFTRLGQIGSDALSSKIPIVVIDHHPREKNPDYLQEIVNPADCSVGKLIYEFIQLYYPEHLDHRIAEALYTAIAGDTGNFRFGNTTRDSHRVAGELMGFGIKAYEIYCKLFGNISHSGVRLFSAVLQNIHFSDDRRVVWFVITRQILKDNGADDTDTEGITDFLRMIEGVEVSIMFKERNDGSTRINFRSKGLVSTNAIARHFGGGGHEHASGIVSDRPLMELYPEVVEMMVRHVKEVYRENSTR